MTKISNEKSVNLLTNDILKTVSDLEKSLLFYPEEERAELRENAEILYSTDPYSLEEMLSRYFFKNYKVYPINLMKVIHYKNNFLNINDLNQIFDTIKEDINEESMKIDEEGIYFYEYTRIYGRVWMLTMDNHHLMNQYNVAGLDLMSDGPSLEELNWKLKVDLNDIVIDVEHFERDLYEGKDDACENYNMSYIIGGTSNMTYEDFISDLKRIHEESIILKSLSTPE